MITFSIIQKSKLESAYRIDAECYQPEFLNVNKKLSKSLKLIDLTKKITDFGAYSQMNFVEYTHAGVRFLRNQDIGEVIIEDSDSVFISEETYQKLSLKLEEFDVLTPRVGTLGNAAIVLKKNLPATANQNLAQIKPNTTKIDPFYLTVFLCSYFGKKQFDRFATGNVQPWLNLIQIKSLKVFVPSIDKQNKIRSLAINSLKANDKSNFLYSQAKDLLLNELGLKDFKIEDDLTCTVNLSDLKSSHRADADYFQPKYETVLSQIRTYNTHMLGDLVSMKKGVEPGSDAYEDEGKLFIRVSSITKHGIIDKDQKYMSDELYQTLRKSYEPKIGDILLTKDATPGIAYVLKETIEGIIAGGIIRLKIKEDIEAEYLALCINSVIGQMQIERDAGGSVIVHWKPEQIKKLQIPVLPKSTQKKIADLICQSHEAREKAKELLEKAKKEVEKLIEGTE
jgi:type I restriction enzyme S subunit